MKNQRFRRVRAAFDLTELALYLVAGILLLIGIIALFENVFGSTKAQLCVQEMTTIVAAIEQDYPTAASMAEITTTTVANSGMLPTTWLDQAPPNATQILAPYGANINAVGEVGLFEVTIQGLPVSACVAIASQNAAAAFGNDLEYITVGNSSNQNTFAPPFLASDIVSYCNSAGGTQNSDLIAYIFD